MHLLKRIGRILWSALVDLDVISREVYNSGILRHKDLAESLYTSSISREMWRVFLFSFFFWKVLKSWIMWFRRENKSLEADVPVVVFEI